MTSLSGPERKFCEGIVSGLRQTDAYQAAFPHRSRLAVQSGATRMIRQPRVKAEIARMRKLAESMGGQELLTPLEKRLWLARLVRANLATFDMEIDGDLVDDLEIRDREDGEQEKHIRLADKLEAIRVDNDLAGDGQEAEAHAELAALLRRLGAPAAVADAES